jgi:hypothetical protein
MEYLPHLLKGSNSTSWNAVQPSEKWRADAGGQAGRAVEKMVREAAG